MIFVLIGVLAIVAVFAALWTKAQRERNHLEEHSITPEALHAQMNAGGADRPGVLLFDVRQPLDFLAELEIIPGARRVPPKEIEQNAKLIPQDRDVVVYCTCPSDATARLVSRRAQEMHFTKVKFLQGGLGAWKQLGYPVEPYTESFHLDTAT